MSPFAIKAEESDKNSNSRLPVKEINNFTQVFEQIRTGYVEEITDVQLLESAIQGMLENLDPHSAYLNDKNIQIYKKMHLENMEDLVLR